MLQIVVQVQGDANGGERGQITGETTMIEDDAKRVKRLREMLFG